MKRAAVRSVLALVLAAAWGPSPAAGQQAAGLPPAAPAPAAPATAAEGEAAPSTPPEATRREGRDPFRPLNLDVKETANRAPKTPLEQYDIGSLTLVAVIWNVSDPKAMVEDDSGLGYTVGVGTPIGRNGGVVKKIEPDSVIVEEEVVDFYGEKKKKDVVLKLKPEGEKRP